MDHQNNTSKAPDTSGGAARILTERLRELGISASGLPAHVSTYLRDLADDEANAIQNELANQITALERRANERLRAQIARRVTFRTVGKAFQKTLADRSGETPDLAQPQASKKAGGAS